MRTPELFDLRGKTALVTGGGEGLGRVLALGLAEAGADIVVCSRKIEKCEQVEVELRGIGVTAMALRCDLNSSDEVDHVVERTIGRFKKIDILVNNAGTTWGGSPEDLSIENWKKVIDLNLTGTFRMTQSAGREMIRQRSGKIINISSYAGQAGTDPAYLDAVPYNTSKGGIDAMTRDLATKWAKYNIRVNAVAPGWFRSKMSRWAYEKNRDEIFARTLIKRFGEEDDFKGVVVFLASRASDYMTGQILTVDGGLTVW